MPRRLNTHAPLVLASGVTWIAFAGAVIGGLTVAALVQATRCHRPEPDTDTLEADFRNRYRRIHPLRPLRGSN